MRLPTNRAGMARKNDLGWSWKPSPSDGELANRKLIKLKKRSGRRGNWLLFAPGEIFYESKAWKRLRRKVLERYGYKCMRCEAVDTEIHVDHIEPRSLKPHLSLSFGNLQVLCRSCNKLKSNLYAYDYRGEAMEREAELAIAREAARRI